MWDALWQPSHTSTLKTVSNQTLYDHSTGTQHISDFYSLKMPAEVTATTLAVGTDGVPVPAKPHESGDPCLHALSTN